MGDRKATVDNLTEAVLDCPESIKWKIWLLYARIMIGR